MVDEPRRPRDEVDIAATAPFVPKRRPERDPMERPPANVLVPVVDVAFTVPNVPVVAARMLPVESVVVAPELVK